MVTTNKFTYGGEFLLDNKEYIGFYHIWDNGKYYTLASHLRGKSNQLTLSTENELITLYNSLESDFSKEDRKYANSYVPANIIGDSIIRYFVRKMNDISSPITEVSEEKYNELQDNPYYFGISIKWLISGPVNDIYNKGIRVQGGVYDSNERTVKEYSKQMIGLENILTNFLEFYNH